jgi:hypothetical protein
MVIVVEAFVVGWSSCGKGGLLELRMGWGGWSGIFVEGEWY